MKSLLAHGNDEVARGVGDYVGSSMYAVLDEHRPALIAGVAVVAVWWLLRFRRSRPGGLLAAYRQLKMLERFVFVLLATAGLAHLVLALSHEPGPLTLAFIGGGVAESAVAVRVLRQRAWRRWGGLVTAGSLLAYAVSAAGGGVDQVGLATKVVELAIFAVALKPPAPRRMRTMLAGLAPALVAILVAFGSWAGAFAAEGGHHLGAEGAGPGTLLPVGVDREPSVAEVEAADDLYAAVQVGVSKYQDPGVAGADGYLADGINGLDFHAPNPAYQQDGRVLDPARPENLIYAAGSDGPVLIGVMFEMEEVGEAGPTPGGPITVWHAHDHVCFSLVPPGLAGLTSPFGVCPLGSITVPMTPEMIHVWTLPGSPTRFGHLDEEWLEQHVG